MTLDRYSFDDLDKEAESDKRKDRAKLQKELDERLKNYDLNFLGSAKKKEEGKQKEVDSFWKKHEEALENSDRTREAFHFRDYGGSKEAARKEMEKYENEQKLQQASENMNEQWKKQEEMGKQQERQNQEAAEKKKKEKEQQENQSKEERRKKQQEEELKKRMEDVRARREQQQDRGRNQ